VDEEGNPIKIASARSLLDLDPFGAPLSAALYVEYKNAGNQALAAVKFRLRYLNGQGKDRGTYHAPHAAALLPGASTAAKWKHDKVYPDVEKVLLRTLMVRFADGSEWHSQRIKGLVIPPHSD